MGLSPQFVDFNRDGLLDIVTATYDGSPHLSLKHTKGFAEPTRLLDQNGARISLKQFWNYTQNKWDEAESQPGGHLTSAVAFDWDNDGDLDLLLGSHGDGVLYRQMNEGTAQKPRFSGKSIPLEAGGKPLVLSRGVTTSRLVDWDGDGLTDLLCGSYGHTYGDGDGGGVYLYMNRGKAGAPEYSPALALIRASPKGHSAPVRPDSGLFPDAVDYDGDGDLDLIVGGYSHYQPPQPKLSPAEERQLSELEAKLTEAEAVVQSLYQGLTVGAGRSEEELIKALEELHESEAYLQARERVTQLQNKIEKFRPGPQRKPFVWLYRRVGTASRL